MNLIPVIDLLLGQVVRAQRGDRKSYRPIVSPLCGSSEPVTVARVLVDHCASSRLYVADLDALQGGAVQAGALRDILQALPGIELWVDAGFTDAPAAEALRDALAPHGDRLVTVFASESLASREVLERCFGAQRAAGANAVLSLDRRDGQRLDAAGCWTSPELWPGRVIVMTLERVGADAGPDLDTLGQVKALSPHTQFIGAGGVRDVADLSRAAEAGAAGWLVASALHDGRIPPQGA